MNKPANIIAQRVRLIDEHDVTISQGTLPMMPNNWPMVILFDGVAYCAETAAIEMIVYRKARQWIADGTLRRAGEMLQ